MNEEKVTLASLVARLYEFPADEDAWIVILDDWVLDLYIYALPKKNGALVIKALLDCELAATQYGFLSGPAMSIKFVYAVRERWLACDRCRL